MTIHVYALRLMDELETPILPYLAHFSPERQQMILRYRKPSDRSRTVWAELLARYLLCKGDGAGWESVSVERGKTGKPRGRTPEGVQEISLSHSGSWVLCSIGAWGSGVDVETCSEGYEEIADHFFSPEENALLQRMPLAVREKEFLRYWTLKESFLKLTGEGLYGDLANIDCMALRRGLNGIGGKNFLLPDGAMSAVCTQREHLPTQMEFLRIREIKDFLRPIVLCSLSY